MLTDYLRFRAFAAPVLIEAVFWFASAGGILGAAIAFAAGVAMVLRDSALLGTFIALPALAALPVWLVLTRIACEGAIVVFRIHEELRDGNEVNSGELSPE